MREMSGLHLHTSNRLETMNCFKATVRRRIGSGHRALRFLKSLLSFLFAVNAFIVPEIAVLAVDVPATPAKYFNDYASLTDPQTAQQLDSKLEEFGCAPFADGTLRSGQLQFAASPCGI
jgi:hypothetical protein